VTTELELMGDLDRTPTTLFASPDPAAIVAQATRIAEVIKPLIKERNLYKRIGNSDHVYIDAWTLTGSMLGVFATTVRTWEIGDNEGYGAAVEARTLTGFVVGRAEAVVMRDEEVGGKRKWLMAPRFQLISMAQTRGASKALRMPLGFVMQLAGYDATPAEEMEAAAARGETVTGGRGVAPGWRDINEQQRAHADLGALIDQHGLRPWVAEWLESKGYQRPLAKGQLNQLRRAIDREIEEKSDPAPIPPSGAGSDQTSGEVVSSGRESAAPPPPRTPMSEAGSSGVSGDGAHSPASDEPVSATDSREGDALPSDNDGVGSATTGPSRVSGDVGDIDPTPPNDPSPVAAWCEQHDISISIAKTFLRRSHAREFPDLRDWKDLQELRPPRSDTAIRYLEAQYLPDEVDRES
jgi:hypothetical protein